MSARKSPLMAMLPLFAAFLLAPLALLAGKLTGRPEVFQPLSLIHISQGIVR